MLLEVSRNIHCLLNELQNYNEKHYGLNQEGGGIILKYYQNLDVMGRYTVCVRIKNCWKSFSNIEITTHAMDSYRQKNWKDIKHYFVHGKEYVNKKRTKINLNSISTEQIFQRKVKSVKGTGRNFPGRADAKIAVVFGWQRIYFRIFFTGISLFLNTFTKKNSQTKKANKLHAKWNKMQLVLNDKDSWPSDKFI